MELADVVVSAVLACRPEEHIGHCLQNSLAVEDAHTLAIRLNGGGQRVWLTPTAIFFEHRSSGLFDLHDHRRAVGADQDD
jgi:hypothetical protein